MFWAIYPFLTSPFFPPFQTLPPFSRWRRDVALLIFSFFSIPLWKYSNFLSKFIFSPIFSFCTEHKKGADSALYTVSLGTGSRGNCFCYNSFANRSLCCTSSLLCTYCAQQPPPGFYSRALDAVEERRGKKTNICCGWGCFQSGLETLNDSRGQFSPEAKGDKHLLIC